MVFGVECFGKLGWLVETDFNRPDGRTLYALILKYRLCDTFEVSTKAVVGLSVTAGFPSDDIFTNPSKPNAKFG